MRQFKIDKEKKTARSANLRRYLVDVNKYDMLSASEEIELANRARKGDRRAIEALVNSNLRFVISVAKSYAGGNAEKLNDLINEGNLGLVEAAQDFDPSTGFKFISYAVWHVRKNMLKWLSNNSRTVRIPQNRVSEIGRIRKAEDSLATRLGRHPMDFEIFDEYEKQEIQAGRISRSISETERNRLKRAILADSIPTCLEGGFDSGSESRPLSPIDVINADPLGTDWDLNQDSAKGLLMRHLSKLTPEEQNIITSFYGIDRRQKTLLEISEELGMTKEGIRSRIKRATSKLRSGFIRSRVDLDRIL